MYSVYMKVSTDNCSLMSVHVERGTAVNIDVPLSLMVDIEARFWKTFAGNHQSTFACALTVQAPHEDSFFFMPVSLKPWPSLPLSLGNGFENGGGVTMDSSEDVVVVSFMIFGSAPTSSEPAVGNTMPIDEFESSGAGLTSGISGSPEVALVTTGLLLGMSGRGRGSEGGSGSAASLACAGTGSGMGIAVGPSLPAVSRSGRPPVPKGIAMGLIDSCGASKDGDKDDDGESGV